MGLWLAGRAIQQLARMHRGQFDDAVLVQAQHHPAHHRRGGVVQVNDGTGHTTQRLKSGLDERRTCWRQHLDGDVVGDVVLLDEQANEVEIGLGC